VLADEFIQDNDLFGFQPVNKEKEKVSKREEDAFEDEDVKTVKSKVRSSVVEKIKSLEKVKDPIRYNRQVFTLKSTHFKARQTP